MKVACWESIGAAAIANEAAVHATGARLCLDVSSISKDVFCNAEAFGGLAMAGCLTPPAGSLAGAGITCRAVLAAMAQ
ncbi:hypothetical protein ACO2Q3_12360 [Caulobacter sp. KR2-114]|uniref:hypothetical protein n=1 Tax=Caulobacter sp. KR2-114 TaxID=3400912 RepID=UPI003C0AA36C